MYTPTEDLTLTHAIVERKRDLRAVKQALKDAHPAELTAAEVAEEAQIAQRRAFGMLKELQNDGVVITPTRGDNPALYFWPEEHHEEINLTGATMPPRGGLADD